RQRRRLLQEVGGGRLRIAVKGSRPDHEHGAGCLCGTHGVKDGTVAGGEQRGLRPSHFVDPSPGGRRRPRSIGRRDIDRKPRARAALIGQMDRSRTGTPRGVRRGGGFESGCRKVSASAALETTFRGGGFLSCLVCLVSRDRMVRGGSFAGSSHHELPVLVREGLEAGPCIIAAYRASAGTQVPCTPERRRSGIITRAIGPRSG